jgi:hypothetical protein
MRAHGAVLLVVLATLAGCSSPPSHCDPNMVEGVCKETGLRVERRTVDDLSGNSTDTWVNDNTTVHVRWGGALASGRLTFRIDDAAGEPVYQQIIRGSAVVDTWSFPGTPGTWTITWKADHFAGRIDLLLTTQ